MMQALAPIEPKTDLQFTDEDKLRIGIAWDALSPNSRRAYQQTWRSVSKWLSSKDATLSDLIDVHFASYFSALDRQCVAPATFSMCVAAVKWFFVNVRAFDVQFPMSQKWLLLSRNVGPPTWYDELDGTQGVDCGGENAGLYMIQAYTAVRASVGGDSLDVKADEKTEFLIVD